jgi:hypothetical protein
MVMMSDHDEERTGKGLGFIEQRKMQNPSLNGSLGESRQ